MLQESRVKCPCSSPFLRALKETYHHDSAVLGDAAGAIGDREGCAVGRALEQVSVTYSLPGVRLLSTRKVKMWPNNRILELFGIQLPIIQAPMAGSVFSEWLWLFRKPEA